MLTENEKRELSKIIAKGVYVGCAQIAVVILLGIGLGYLISVLRDL